MASEAHCAYCFECLSASLEKRPALSLKEIESLWAKYDTSGEDEDQNLVVDEKIADAAEPAETSLSRHRPAAISRLLAPSPSSASSSTPSTSSSTPSLPTDASSTTSKSSSRSSFFSLGRKSKIAEVAVATEEYPLFVTWNTIGRNGSKSLRGCIGTFEEQELDDGLRSYALTSAFDDTRFLPVTARELPTLECGVTLLTNFQPAADPMAWEIGKHGLRISFSYHGRRYGSTYLPDVAREQGWTKEETMISLMRKAGWNGRRDDWRKVSDLNVITYQGHKVALEYKEWREWRDWVEENNLEYKQHHHAPERTPPIIKPAQSPPKDPEHCAAIIFLHGLGDEAAGWENVADQFQSASLLPHLQWLFPEALENHDAMQRAWYTPSRLSARPRPRPELAEDEDEPGMLASMAYIESLLDELVASGVPPNRIVLAGFSQGCAMTLLTGLVSAKYAGKLGGLVRLSGCLPLPERIQELRAERGLPAEVGLVPVFLVRGGKDFAVPRRYLTECVERLKAWRVKDEAVEVREYADLAHSASPAELRDLYTWLEKHVPPLE